MNDYENDDYLDDDDEYDDESANYSTAAKDQQQQQQQGNRNNSNKEEEATKKPPQRRKVILGHLKLMNLNCSLKIHDMKNNCNRNICLNIFITFLLFQNDIKIVQYHFDYKL
jgi:hypothetical protein